MSSFENSIRAMTSPRNGVYPRPWTTDTNPEQAAVLIVGASSAKTFRVTHVGSHDQFLDALWNRNGQTCRAMYDAATTKPSPTRRNLDRLSEMLAAHGLTSLQTNVACASARYDAELSKEDRTHGTELFKAVVANVSWKAMIVYGVNASERFSHAFGIETPAVPFPGSAPVSMIFHKRPVFISPTLAHPAYRASVWPYLERVVAVVAKDTTVSDATAPQQRPSITVSPLSTLPLHEDTASSFESGTPIAFKVSPANLLVWRRIHAIEATSGLIVRVEGKQARLDGPTCSNTTRVFRHKFTKAKADILVREDVFRFDPSLWEVAPWTPHKNPVFQNVQTGDRELLNRILDIVADYAAKHAP